MGNAIKKEDEYTVRQAEARIGVSHTTIYNAMRSGAVKFRKRKSSTAFNGVALIKESDLLEFYENLRASGNLNKGPKKEAPHGDAAAA
jgi:hypothetical protein